MRGFYVTHETHKPGSTRHHYTVMVQNDNGYGTIWIDYVDCPLKDGDHDYDAISKLATEKCASEEGLEDDEDLLCMGIIEGDARFIMFDDNHLRG
jgi:hypothetical protein